MGTLWKLKAITAGMLAVGAFLWEASASAQPATAEKAPAAADAVWTKSIDVKAPPKQATVQQTGFAPTAADSAAAPAILPPMAMPSSATTAAPAIAPGFVPVVTASEGTVDGVPFEAGGRGPHYQNKGFDFDQVPNVKPQPHVYNMSPRPTGEGYYSFLDFLGGNLRDGPPKYGYTRLVNQSQPFFDADFRYLDNPENTDHVWTDSLKRIRIGDNFMFSTGGQAWMRYMDITNQGLGKKDSNEDLYRVRTYGDLWYQDKVRLYVEFISATTQGQNVPPGPNDINRADFLDLFMDFKIMEIDGKPAYVRVGRQELAMGSQRLISNIDFTNTKRTFEGARATYKGQNWDYDAWWLRPVVINPTAIDSWDDKVNFAGSWATYHPNKSDLLDLYYLYLDNQNKTVQLGIDRYPTVLHTFGSRYTGRTEQGFLWDFEGAMQLGTNGPQDVVAGMGTAGVGYNFKTAPMNPSTWIYYDYASGSNDPGKGTDTTFNQLFAFGHNYFGSLDVVGRQNIHDLSMQQFFYPTDYLTCQVQYHQLWLAQAKDALYNYTGAAIRRDASGADGTNIGSILNFIVNFHISANQDVQVGYGHLYGGTFLQKTGTSQMDYTYITYNLKW